MKNTTFLNDREMSEQDGKTRNISSLPDHIYRGIVQLGEKYNIRKILLFGSRARGDNSRTSDIDLAISGGNTASFLADIEEEIPTLLMFDVVDTGHPVQGELLEAIEREGRLLYEKN